MNIAIIGNRIGWTYEEVRDILKKLNVYKSDVIISGGADGVDTFAQRYAKEIGAEIQIIYPDPSYPSPDRFFRRNTIIALRCDSMIAFNKKGNRSGTQNAINSALHYKKPVMLVKERGVIEECQRTESQQILNV